MTLDFTIQAIDHGAAPVIAFVGLLLVAIGRATASDVTTIIGAIAGGGGAIGTGVQVVRRRRRH